MIVTLRFIGRKVLDRFHAAYRAWQLVVGGRAVIRFSPRTPVYVVVVRHSFDDVPVAVLGDYAFAKSFAKSIELGGDWHKQALEVLDETGPSAEAAKDGAVYLYTFGTGLKTVEFIKAFD